MQEVLHLDQQIVNRQIHGMEMSIMSEWEVRTLKEEEFWGEYLNDIFTKFWKWMNEVETPRNATEQKVCLAFSIQVFFAADYIKERFLKLIINSRLACYNSS